MIQIYNRINLFNNNNHMNPKLAVIAMVNGMIGGVILVLPLLALEAGTLLTFFVIILTGAFSFYSCYLCVLHLGNHSDLDKAILHHFNQSKFMKIAYDFLVFINLLFLLVLYYDLIVQQWEGLLPYNIANPLCNAFALFCLVFVLNYFHFGAKLLGYGIISIVGYCIFLIWLLASAPSGDETIPIAGDGEVNMAASMGQAFAIQTFFIPVLKELPNPEKYARYTFIAYAIGCTVYIYIGYMGSFGLVNRLPFLSPPQTVENYFERGYWEVAVVEVIYLIHLYSAFPEFLLICKYYHPIMHRKRFFSMLSLRQSKQGQILRIPEIIFTIVFIGVCFGIFMSGFGIDTLIQINGAVIGFFFIYFLPALLHVKCLYWCGNKERDPLLDSTNSAPPEVNIEMKELPPPVLSHPQHVELSDIQNAESTNPRSTVLSSNPGTKTERTDTTGSTATIDLACKCQRPTSYMMGLDILMIVGMVGLGAFIMVDGIISVIQSV